MQGGLIQTINISCIGNNHLHAFYAPTKNRANLTRASTEFLCLEKTAITFGEGCIVNLGPGVANCVFNDLMDLSNHAPGKPKCEWRVTICTISYYFESHIYLTSSYSSYHLSIALYVSWPHSYANLLANAICFMTIIQVYLILTQVRKLFEAIPFNFLLKGTLIKQGAFTNVVGNVQQYTEHNELTPALGQNQPHPYPQ